MTDANAARPGVTFRGERGRRSGRRGLGVARAWLSLTRRKVRLIGGSRLPASAAILRICSAPSLADALLLAATCERPLACVLDDERVSGAGALLAPALGLILNHAGAPGRHRALRQCTEALISGELLAVFEQPAGPGGSGQADFSLACEAWAAAYPDRFPAIIPLELFRPMERSQEILVHVGEPLEPDPGEDAPVAHSAPQLDAAFRAAYRDRVFGLDSGELNRLLAGIEDALRGQLESEWAPAARRRQAVDGFHLSPMAAEAIDSLNRERPEALVHLLRLADADRDARRQWSLVRLRAEFGRRQFSPWQRVLGWAESLAGFPVALYGALNHLVAALALLVAGLGPRRKPATAAVWWGRALAVLGGYAVQIALVDHLLGRAGAGYYAATLPASGAYLARYAWLLRRRTRVLLLGIQANRLRGEAEKRRRKFHDGLEEALTAVPSYARDVPAL